MAELIGSTYPACEMMHVFMCVACSSTHGLHHVCLCCCDPALVTAEVFNAWVFSQLQESQEQEASTSGRNAEPQGVGVNNVLLALAAAYVLPGPLFPLVALTLPFWLSGKSRRRSRSSSSDVQPETTDSGDSDWMLGSQRQQQTGFGFSDGPAQDSEADRGDSEMTVEEQEERRRQRRQQQMAAFQQQQMLLNMMRMMGGGMMGGYRGGFGGPFGMRGGFRRGPFMF